MPQVSVIMTVYNAELFVEQAINSILNQRTTSELEFIIVDDGSTDSTPDILSRYKDHPQINVIFAQRIGRARALNLAWTNANSEYIANIDADDIAEPDRIEKQLQYLVQNPNIGLLATACKIHNDEDGSERIKIPPLNDQQIRAEMIRSNPIVHSTVMMPKSVLTDLGGYDENLRVVIDYDLWARIASIYEIACIPDITMVIRARPKSFFRHTIPAWEKQINTTRTRLYIWRKFYRNPKDLYFVIEPIVKWAYRKTAIQNSKIE